MTRMPVAGALAQVLDLPVRFEAYDGSVAGPADADITLQVRSSKALAHLVSAPGELGLARAYVSGELDFDGADHYTLLRAMSRQKIGDLTWAQRLAVLRSIGPEVLQWVADVLPLTYLIDLMNGVYLRGDSFLDHPKEIAIVTAWGLVGVAIAWRRFGWEPRER